MVTRLLLLFLLPILLHSHLVYRQQSNRVVRQTLVSSNGNADGTGDQVNADSSAQNYKNADGTIGTNITATGNATGANAAQIQNTGTGAVGNMSVTGAGNVGAQGTNSQVYSDIFSEIYKDTMSVSNMQQGEASGTGDTEVQSTGNSGMTNNGIQSPSAADNSIAKAGATGSNSSLSQISSSQILTWDELIAQLYGHAIASGATNAQANLGLGAGSPDNGIEVDGLVSGMNKAGGQVGAEVEGSGTMNGEDHDLTGSLSGSVNGTGPSQLVGANNLSSNSSLGHSSISAFGDANSDTDGQSALNMQADTSNSNGTAGEIDSNNNVDGGNKNMTVQNGLQVQDNKGDTLALGYGQINGNGTQNSNASIGVNSKYNENGDAEVIATGQGSAVSNDKNSSLGIGGSAHIEHDGQTNDGTANSGGNVMGAYNNLTGTGDVTVDNNGSDGQASMEANGGGPGNSAADTNAQLNLDDGGVQRIANVSGSVQAFGDNTSVQSISSVSDQNGVQTLTNLQHATSESNGSSSASASNTGYFKRRKRSSLGVLFDLLL